MGISLPVYSHSTISIATFRVLDGFAYTARWRYRIGATLGIGPMLWQGDRKQVRCSTLAGERNK